MLNKRRVGYNDIALISSNISKLYDENINFLKILELLNELPLRRCYKESLKMVLEIIKRGGSLEESFSIDKNLFPSFFIAMINIGENTGEVSSVFKYIGIFYKKMDFIIKKGINALIYPLVLIGALIVLFMFVIFFFIPNMADVYIDMGNGVPSIYNGINKYVEFVLDSPFIASIFIIFWGFLLPYILFTKFLGKQIKEVVFKMPICRLFNEYVSVLVMSVIVNSGINISIGIDKCCKCNLLNSIAKEKLIIMNESINRGKSIFYAMEKSNLFSKYTLAHIKLGEESGAIDERLIVLEEELFLSLCSNIDNLLKLIEPVLIMVMATVVIIFLFIFILPLFNNIFII